MQAPVKLTVDRPLPLNDGIRALDFDTVLVTVNANSYQALAANAPISGALYSVDVTGNKGHVTVLDATLDQPTSVVVLGDDAWVSEGQILRFAGVDKSPPQFPFKLRRVPLK